MRLLVGFNRKAIRERSRNGLVALWHEPFHDPEVMYAKGRRTELVNQIMATAQGAPAPDEFVALAAEKVASLPAEDRREAAWRLAHELVVRAALARQLMEEP